MKKLMKYDLKNMMKILWIMYVVSLGLACITRIINIGKDIQAIAILGYVFAGLTYSAIGSILVNTFVHIIRVFIVSFYKDESYLTHTLPVSKGKLLLSKYLSSVIVILCSVVVSFLSLVIILYSKGFIDGLRTLLNMATTNLNMPLSLFITLLVIVIFTQICAMISMGFTAIVKGNMYNQKRLPKGLIWFAIFYFLSVIVSLLVMLLVFAISGNVSSFFAEKLSSGAFITILVVGIVLYIIYAIIYYFICNKLFKKGVNVD